MGRGSGDPTGVASATRRSLTPRTLSEGRAALFISETGSEILLPTMVSSKEEGDRLSLVFLEGGRFSFVAGNDMDGGYRNSLDRLSFATSASDLADHVLAGGDQARIEVLDGGLRAPGLRQVAILMPFRFRRGRQRHIAIGHANLNELASASLRWGDDDRSFSRFIVRAEDLRDACKLLRYDPE